jgi:dimeric dUTPase (all-alpha-NTP-PPase superfamily)
MYYLDIRDNAIVPSTLHSFFMAMMKDLSIDTTTIDGYYFEKNYKKRL